MCVFVKDCHLFAIIAEDNLLFMLNDDGVLPGLKHGNILANGQKYLIADQCVISAAARANW